MSTTKIPVHDSKGNVTKFMTWRVHTPNLLKEIGNSNTQLAGVGMPLAIFGHKMTEATQQAQNIERLKEILTEPTLLVLENSKSNKVFSFILDGLLACEIYKDDFLDKFPYVHGICITLSEIKQSVPPIY